MASRIQGITVEIGGDTTKLSTALSKVNKEIRDTQSQLKDVNKLLKLDPGNAELMAQKQRLLSQAVSETKEKLDALKLAGQQANEALAKGEISQSQYDALQREIIETEDGCIVGYLWTTFCEDEESGFRFAEIQEIYVEEEYRRHGVATQLYEYAEAKARCNDAKVIRSGTGLCNRVSIQLHERLGFAPYRYEFEKLLMDNNNQ